MIENWCGKVMINVTLITTTLFNVCGALCFSKGIIYQNLCNKGRPCTLIKQQFMRWTLNLMFNNISWREKIWYTIKGYINWFLIDGYHEQCSKYVMVFYSLFCSIWTSKLKCAWLPEITFVCIKLSNIRRYTASNSYDRFWFDVCNYVMNISDMLHTS